MTRQLAFLLARRSAAVTGCLATLGCIAAAAGSASTVQVAGIQSAPQTGAGYPCRTVDPQTGLAPILKNAMTGSLLGCWYTDTVNEVQSDPSGSILAIGTEHFAGCLDSDRDRACTHGDLHGTLAFIYAFEGTFDQAGRELSGQCQHPITSGTRDFRGASGQINFTDNVTNGTSAYQGRIILAGHATAGRAAAAQSRPVRPIC